MEIVACIVIFLSFLLSASCGLGGSLLLIPMLSLVLGVKEGIVLSSLLLGLNNIVKALYYRQYIRWKQTLWLLLPMAGGAAIGAVAMVHMQADWLGYFMAMHIIVSFAVQRWATTSIQKSTGIGYAALSGFCSGLSGTSGPLKGIAVRCFYQSKTTLVAAASVLSLATDSIKSGIYLSQIPGIAGNMMLLGFGIVIMPFATGLGRYLNQQMSTRVYDALFYTVMGGYVMRLFI